MKAERRLELAGLRNPACVELARWVSLATRIDAVLLRRARLGFMPRAKARTEANLWFGPLVQTRGARFILLYPDVAALLRQQLAEDSSALARAWELVRDTHGYLPRLARLEEELTWLALSDEAGRAEQINDHWRGVIKSLVTEGREGLGRWALNVLPRLPAKARTERAELLQWVAESRLHGGWRRLLLTTGKPLSNIEKSLLVHGLEHVDVGVRLRGDVVEVSEPPAPGAQTIGVPRTNPRVLELSWGDDEDPQQTSLTWESGHTAYLRDVTAPVTIGTLSGDRFQLDSQRSVIESLRESVKPYLACLVNDDYQPVGTGWLVEGRRVLTGELSLRRAAALGQRESVSSGLTVRVSFPLLPDSKPIPARVLHVDEQRDAEGLVLLELERPPVAGARPAELKAVWNAFGKSHIAVSFSRPRTKEYWGRFSVDEAQTEYAYTLSPTSERDAAAAPRTWSGSPLIDRDTGAVIGMCRLHGSQENPRMRLVPEDLLYTIIDRRDSATPPPPRLPAFPKFEHDVFISYAQFDDEPWPPGQKGWVTMLYEALRLRVSQLLGTEANIWRYAELLGNEPLRENMLTRLSMTAVFVAVISPSYVISEWCKKELEKFCEEAERHGGLWVGEASRLFKVIKTPTMEGDKLWELADLLGHQFYRTTYAEGRIEEFRPNLDDEPKRRFYKTVDDLSRDIVETLRVIKEGPAPLPASAPGRAITVYLANTTSDLNPARNSIRRELQQRGCYVLPERKLPPRGVERLTAAAREDLRRSQLSIHLVGESYGIIPDGARLSMPHLELDLAAERSADPDFSRLIWIPQPQSANDDRQRRFVESLLNDPRELAGIEVMTVQLEEFKSVIVERLSQLKWQRERPRDEASALRMASGVQPSAAGDEQGSIYLICNEVDRARAGELAANLRDKRLKVVIPTSDASALETHRAALSVCDAVVIYYGECSQLWVQMMTMDVRKSLGYRKSRWRSMTIYMASPMTEEKKDFRSAGFRLVRDDLELSGELA